MAESSYSRSAKRQRTEDPDGPRRPVSERIGFILYESFRAVIPVLPRFQADVPEWTDPDPEARVTIPDGYENDPNTLKWLGTTTLAVGNDGMNGNGDDSPAVGGGRPEKCNCIYAGSAYCVEGHVEEERARLQAELGPEVFETWKFDEYDEGGFWGSWTSNDYRAFNDIVRNTRTAEQRRTFLTRAYEALPWRKREIYAYYVTFMVPRRLARETRWGVEEIDSDTDEMLKRFVNRIHR